MRMNIPNKITLGRLLLTFFFFGLLTRYSAAKPETHWVLSTCFWIYLVAALTDLLDGYLARTWKQVTAFGRVMDPVVAEVSPAGPVIVNVFAPVVVEVRPVKFTLPAASVTRVTVPPSVPPPEAMEMVSETPASATGTPP